MADIQPDNRLVIELAPTQPAYHIALVESDSQIVVDFVSPSENLVLELSPTLFMTTNPDNTNYLLYYDLAKD